MVLKWTGPNSATKYAVSAKKTTRTTINCLSMWIKCICKSNLIPATCVNDNSTQNTIWVSTRKFTIWKRKRPVNCVGRNLVRGKVWSSILGSIQGRHHIAVHYVAKRFTRNQKLKDTWKIIMEVLYTVSCVNVCFLVKMIWKLMSSWYIITMRCYSIELF